MTFPSPLQREQARLILKKLGDVSIACRLRSETFSVNDIDLLRDVPLRFLGLGAGDNDYGMD